MSLLVMIEKSLFFKLWRKEKKVTFSQNEELSRIKLRIPKETDTKFLRELQRYIVQKAF